MTLEAPLESRSFRAATSLPKAQTKPLPASLDAERAILCAGLRRENLIDELSEITPAHFHHPAHGTIWEVLQDMRDGCRPIDLVTVFQELADKNLIEQTGGNSTLAHIQTMDAVISNYREYSEILIEKYVRRKAIAILSKAEDELYLDHSQGNLRIISDSINSLQSLTRDKDSLVRHIGDFAMQSIESIERLYKSGGKINGIATGFEKIDRSLDGLKGGQMIVIAARPSMGKSALGMQIVTNAARAGVPCAVFSLEMSGEQLTTRIICSTSGTSLKNIKNGMAKNEMNSIGNHSFALSKLPIYIDETAAININSLKSKARAFKKKYDIGLIMIDYLQLVTSLSKRAQNSKVIEITEISNGIKQIAKELRIPVIALAQLNRDIEKRKGGRPVLSDLKDSGSIEQDADVVVFIHRPKEKDAEEAEIIIAKNRDGACGFTKLWFMGETTSFRDIAD
jgi:replicative DNA helicase